MKILITADSFKESLTASEVCRYLQHGILSKDAGAEVVINPVSDGGEGILDLLIADQGVIHTSQVTGPLGAPVKDAWGTKGTTAIIEMANASGLPLVSPDKRNPFHTTTYGVGELITHALNTSTDTIIIGLGGSATNDGGTGMLLALGFELLDSKGRTIPYGNAGLEALATIHDQNADPRLAHTKFVAATDVQNILTGPQGATYTYGQQKGARQKDLEIMDNNMRRYAKIIQNARGMDVNSIPGSGAAGGLGAALVAFLYAEIIPGFKLVSDFTGLESKVKDADIIITGEGKLDSQTLLGKAPYGVAQLARKYDKFLIAIGGTIDNSSLDTLKNSFDLILPISQKPVSKEESIAKAGELLEETGRYIMKLIMEGNLPNLRV